MENGCNNHCFTGGSFMGCQCLYQQFKEKAEAVSARVYCVASPQEAVQKIAGLVKGERDKRDQDFLTVWALSSLFSGINLDSVLADIGPVIFTDMEHHADEAFIGIAEADLAIAETGTLVQDATDLNQRLATMFPYINILVARTSSLVPTFADALNSFAAEMPGYLAFITGPSRTADIENVLAIGVHGPEHLWIILIDDEGGEILGE
jgi:L-lactate dehydrogenase complex protein LldG